MSSVFTEDNVVLQELWKKHNRQEEEYISKQSIIEWTKNALEETKTLQNYQESLTDLDGLVRQYLSEVHEVTEENTQNLSMSFKEAVDFLKWLTNTQQQKPINNQLSEEAKYENFQQYEEKIDENRQQSNDFKENIQVIKQSFHQQQNKSLASQKNQHSSPISSSQQIQNQKQSTFKKAKTEININQSDQQIKPMSPKQQLEYKDNLTNNPNEFDIETLSKKYKDFLRIIFDHYCKVSYATGQDPTFEQIMHKTTIMTINKFMIFSKDFQLAKASPLVNRSFLIQIFKKNSECYKEMSFEQFIDVFKKLAEVAFNGIPKPIGINSENTSSDHISEDLVKLLEFCEIATAKKFKDKMKKLNIQYRLGQKTNAELKVVPDGYKFKFASNNGKSQEQIKQELLQRKVHRSERRIFLSDKLNQNDLSLNKKRYQGKKNDVSRDGRLQPIKESQAQSAQIINKIVTPMIPNPRRPNNLPPPPPLSRPSNTPIQTSTGTNNRDVNNIFKKELGYAELHKFKQTQSYSRKRNITNGQSGNFKLNSIVQQARIQLHNANQPTPITSDMSESIATNSREQTQRLKAYDINKINSKMQLINDKIKRDKEMQQQLGDLLEIGNDQEDQFLIEHLEREKKNDVIGKRLSNRINQLEYKR